MESLSSLSLHGPPGEVPSIFSVDGLGKEKERESRRGGRPGTPASFRSPDSPVGADARWALGTTWAVCPGTAHLASRGSDTSCSSPSNGTHRGVQEVTPAVPPSHLPLLGATGWGMTKQPKLPEQHLEENTPRGAAVHPAPPQAYFPAMGLLGHPLTLGRRATSERLCCTQVSCEERPHYANLHRALQPDSPD